MTIDYRTIEKTDYPFLREMLYVAVFVPPGGEPYPRSILDLPEIAKYINGWGRPGDFGLILLKDDNAVGAVWSRLFSEMNKGYGFIDADIPEFSIAVKPAFQNHGLGTQLMQAYFDAAKARSIQAISLSVDQRNPAVNLYLRLGFRIVKRNETDYIMLKELE